MTRIGMTYDDRQAPPVAVSRALSVLGDVVSIPTNDELPARLKHDSLEIVFSVARHSDAAPRRLQVAAFLDYFGIPYLGGDALAQATCLQRARMKETLSYHGVPTASITLVDREEQLASLARRAFPVRVRRARHAVGNADSHVARDFDELRRTVYARLGELPDEPLLVESILPGEAFSCAMLGNGKELVLLPIVSHDNGDDARLLGTDSGDESSRRTAVRLSDGLTEEIEALAFRAWSALGCRDLARIDVQLNGAGVPHVTAVDPLPSLALDDGDAAMRSAASAAGLDDHELVQRSLLIAAKRARLEIRSAPNFSRLPRRTPPGSIRVALQS